MVRFLITLAAALALTAVGVATTVVGGVATGAAPSCSKPLAPGLHRVALTDQGQSRPFLLFVPRRYDGHRNLPVVFNLHGSNGNGLDQLQTSRIRPVANANGFAVIAPNGAVEENDESFRWNVPGVPLTSGEPVPAGTPSDVRYLMAVLAKTQSRICVDSRRVYFAGFSGGARMTSTMACLRPHRIAAIAPVAGLRAGTPEQIGGRWVPARSTCRPARPVPVIAFHGTADQTNPYQGNDDPRWGYSVPVALARWANIDGCGRPPATRRVTSTVDSITYPRCRGGSAVVLLREEGAEHTWPDGSSPGELNASPRMWAFFKQHPRPR